MASKKQKAAARHNIKIAQRTWDRMHYSVDEGKIEPKIAASGGTYYFSSKHTKQKDAIEKANNLRKRGFRAVVKYLTIKGKNIFLVYKGMKRKRAVVVAAGTGPKGHYHKRYKKSGPKWRGYGKKEKPGLGRGK